MSLRPPALSTIQKPLLKCCTPPLSSPAVEWLFKLPVFSGKQNDSMVFHLHIRARDPKQLPRLNSGFWIHEASAISGSLLLLLCSPNFLLASSLPVTDVISLVLITLTRILFHELHSLWAHMYFCQPRLLLGRMSTAQLHSATIPFLF